MMLQKIQSQQQTFEKPDIDKHTNRDHKDALSTLESDVDTIQKDDKGNL